MKFRITASLLVMAAALFCLFMFRSLPVSKIWRSYSVMYVANRVGEESVLSYLERAGCRDVVTLSAQRVPFASPYLPVAPKASTYLEDRLSFFRDESGAYNLFYIPEAYQQQAQQALLQLLRETRAEAGLDGHAQYPWAVPLVAAATCLVLLLASRNKGALAFPALFPVLLTLSQPFYTVAAGACLLLLAMFLAHGLWGRRHMLHAVAGSVYVGVLGVSAVALFFWESPRSGALALLAVLSSALAALLAHSWARYADSLRPFSFTPIFSATQMAVVNRRTSPFLLFLALPLGAIVFLLLTTTTVYSRAALAGLSIPVPGGHTVPGAHTDSGRTLPSLEDYFQWAWKTATFPYRNLHDARMDGPVADGSVVAVEAYSQTNSGIQVVPQVLFVYNEGFKASLEEDVRRFDYPAVEKLLVEQGQGTRFAYSEGVADESGAVRRGAWLAAVIIALTEPLVLYALYLISGRRKI